MTTESAILETTKRLPEPIKQALLLYAQFLASQYAEGTLPNQSDEKKASSLSGSLKGTFVLPLPDDFDQPLEDFKEYM